MAILPVSLHKVVLGSSTEIPDHAWTINKTANVAKVHNARDGVKRIPTLHDAEGSCSTFFDDSVAPDDEFEEGAVLTAKFYVTAAAFYTGQIIIMNLKISPTTMEGEGIAVDFDWALASGTLTPPDFTP